ncbi:MAG: hypothetical protein ACQGVK_02750 [Myxococcota bacterium]
MKIAVVDTNVLVAANGNTTQADAICELQCIEELEAIKSSGTVALDMAGEILEEYSRYCAWSGSPGVGDEFFRWAHDTAYSSGILVAITPDPHRSYEEFPDVEGLVGFDRNDRKFVAVASACEGDAEVVNALDSDYSIHAKELKEAGISVRELCPQCLPPKALQSLDAG